MRSKETLRTFDFTFYLLFKTLEVEDVLIDLDQASREVICPSIKLVLGVFSCHALTLDGFCLFFTDRCTKFGVINCRVEVDFLHELGWHLFLLCVLNCA